MLRPGILALVALIVGVPAGGASAQTKVPVERLKGPLVTSTIDARYQGKAVARNFLGFSQEFNIIASELGKPGLGTNHIMVQLYRNLAEPGGGAPLLRLGGNSQDQSWWNPEGKPRPREILVDINHMHLYRLAPFLEATDSRVIWGLNMAINDPAYPVAMAQAVQSNLPPGRVEAFEVGNEPHVYPVRVLALDEQGNKVYTRHSDYDHADYLPEFARHVEALRTQVTPQPPLTGPGYCCNPWLYGFPKLLNTVGKDLEMAAFHRYPLESCDLEPGEPGYPTLGELLDERQVSGPANEMRPSIRMAEKKNLEVRITETNSATCGGAASMSDRFGAALWAADWFFTLASIGVSGADLHMSSPLYQAFGFRPLKNRWVGFVRPVYFGQMLFAEATPHGSRYLPTSRFSTKTRRGGNVKVWGWYDPKDKVVRTVVINKHPYQRGDARIRIPQARGAGRLERLSAPSIISRKEVTWAGQSFPEPTFDGKLQGRHVTKKVRRGRKRAFTFKVQAGSAALLTVPVGRVRGVKR